MNKPFAWIVGSSIFFVYVIAALFSSTPETTAQPQLAQSVTPVVQQQAVESNEPEKITEEVVKQSTNETVKQVEQKPAPNLEVKKEEPKVVKSTASCGEDYYRNVDGNCVHRPSSSPSGASAKCRDGSYSYSQNRRGTCSGHGGVASWL